MSEQVSSPSGCELTVILPCLNEAETLEVCIRKAQNWMIANNVDGEVIVADNGSTDGSLLIAQEAQARVVHVAQRGYGAALRGGIAAADGAFLIMGDADDSYALDDLGLFLERLRAGDDVVMGNRFAGGIDSGAMPFLHRYVGNPILSLLGRKLFKVPVRDFHCGLRGMNTASVRALNLRSAGMEFASEMVMKSALAGNIISEVPTRLQRDGRSRAPHLRTWRDGWRHLRFLLLYSPRWLFLIPGALAFVIGLAVTAAIVVRGELVVGSTHYSFGTLIYASTLATLGFQSVTFGLFTKIYAVSKGFLPKDSRIDEFAGRFSMERGLLAGALLLVAGVGGAFVSFWRWRNEGFGSLDVGQQIRVVVPAALGIFLGTSTMLASLFLSILGMDKDIQIG